jgi:hypothetical protein
MALQHLVARLTDTPWVAEGPQVEVVHLALREQQTLQLEAVLAAVVVVM